MIGKYLVKLATRFALRRNDAIRISNGYQDARQIGVIYSRAEGKRLERIGEFIAQLERDGKGVSAICFIPKLEKGEEPGYPYFTERDMSAKGKWRNEEMLEFEKQPFDYLVNLDRSTNKFFKHVLAASKAKCRVGCFEEGSDKYFELMINHGDDNYDTYLDQVYHYLKNMRNG